jgi:hypothetical protein
MTPMITAGNARKIFQGKLPGFGLFGNAVEGKAHANEIAKIADNTKS